MRALQVLPFALLLSCSSTPKNQGQPSGSLAVEVDRVMPANESLEASSVEVTLALENSTGSALEVESVDYEFDTKDVGGTVKGTVKSGASVEPQQRAELKFKQNIPFPEAQEAYQAVLERQTIPFDLKGTVKLANGDTLPFERSGEVATPVLPRFVVNDAQAARYGTDGVDVTLFLRLLNDNVFPVLIQDVSYTVYVNDKEIRSQTAAVGLRLMAGSAEEYEESKTIAGDAKDFSKEELKQILASGQLTYKVEGKIELSRLTIPFEHTGEIKLATGE